MSTPNIAREWFRVIALLPVYDEETGGNFTQVWLEGKVRLLLLRRRVDTVRRQLARYLQVDEEAQRGLARQVLDRYLHLPLVLHEELVLVPLRFREVRARDDGATGYVNAPRVIGCRREGRGSLLTFRDGSSLGCLNSVRRVRAALHEGRLVLEEVRRRRAAACPARWDTSRLAAPPGQAGPASCPPDCPWRSTCR